MCTLTQLLVAVPAVGASSENLNEDIQAAEAAEARNDVGETIRLNTQLLSSPEFPAKNRPMAYFNRGLAYRQNKQPDLAIVDFGEAIRLDKNYAEAYTFRGAAYLDMNDADKAIADLEKAIRLKPRKMEAHYYAGVAYANKGFNQAAFKEFSTAIRLDPQYAMAYRMRGVVREAMGKWQDAIADLNEAIQHQPSLALAYSDRGLAYFNTGSPERAMADMDMAIRLGATDGLTHYRRGMMLFKVGRKDREKEVLADLDQAIQLRPDDFPSAYFMRGMILGQTGDTDRAIKEYTSAILLKHDYAVAYFQRALSYQMKGEAALALADYDTALQLHPESAMAYYYRGVSYAEKGDFDSASRDMGTALRLKPDDAALFLRTRGVFYFAEGRFEDARADFSEAVRVSSGLDHYAVLWKYLADGRTLEHPDIPTGYMEQKAGGQWPDPILLFYVGKLKSKDAYASANSDDPRLQLVQQCEMTFFDAEYQLLQKRADVARQLFRRAASSCPHLTEAKIVAPGELQRMDE